MPTSPTPADRPVWVDGDPLMEATASAVWEQCRTENSIVVDDPRNIAAVAATVARQLLGTTTGAASDLGPADGQQKMRLLTQLHASLTPIPEETDEEREQREDQEATARDHAAGDHQHCGVTCEVEMPTHHLRNFILAKGYPGTAGALDELLRRAAAPPAPADRAATLTAVADEVEQVFLGELNDERALSLHDALIVLRSKLPCTCARSQGLHAKGCQRYVAGHDLLSPVLRLARAREDLSRLAADAAAGVQPPTSEADTALAAAIPEWEAVYEPGNVSDYLIGYANTEAAAKGAAIAWVLSQSDKTADRLEWTPTSHGDDYDEHFELSERHDDGIDTAVGVTVRRRLRPYTAADFAPEADEQPAAPAAPEEQGR